MPHCRSLRYGPHRFQCTVRDRDSSNRCSSLTEANDAARGAVFPFALGRALADARGGCGSFRGVVGCGALFGETPFLGADFTGLDDMAGSFYSGRRRKCRSVIQGVRL
ncbi:hypothetical protein NSPZN2_70165 [Nitrospira defluvii]|uniref:Uncharacterized protein n=1 Tax=Nitrospira defluvii TaxID=330214 RepID=A0ABM8SA93_9BACT|nr:hypothetical protein NSPZN2_70165 [Nitrospira defluvii]